MMKSKFHLFTIVFWLVIFNSFGQVKKSIDVSFYEKGKEVHMKEFFASMNSSWESILFENGKLVLDEEHLKNAELGMLLIYKRKAIKFNIKPNEIYYLKISECRNGIFKKSYEINQGFDYVELVPIHSNCIALFSSEIEKWLALNKPINQ